MKSHYYLLSFSETQGNVQRTAAVSIAVSNQRVTALTITKARAGAGMTASAVLLAVSYLGHMTAEEFNYEAE